MKQGRKGTTRSTKLPPAQGAAPLHHDLLKPKGLLVALSLGERQFLMVEKRFLSAQAYWRELNARGVPIGRDAVQRAVRDGRIRSFRVGSRARIPRSELEAWPERLLAESKQ